MNKNEVYLGDCLELIKELEPQSVDLILTDPPFKSTDLHFDKEGFDIGTWLKECLRVLKCDGYIASFGSIELLATIQKTFPIRFSGFWQKSAPVMRTASAKKPMSKSEPYVVYAHPNHKVKNLTWNPIKIYGYKPFVRVQRNNGYKRGGKDSISRANGGAFTEDGYICTNDGFRWQTDVILCPNKRGLQISERTEHPTQKPNFVMERFVLWLTNEGDFVIDPFAGSGTVGEVSMVHNRDFVLFEKHKPYYGIITKRLQDTRERLGQIKEPKQVKNGNARQLGLF